MCQYRRVAEEVGLVGVGDELVVAGEDGGAHVLLDELAALGAVVEAI